ncbi:isochorismatase family protein [Antribacter sp. KLBMP9083]|uniref:Isochorismatase family protein n=1 Tax=Antribacter soli TaxID=2910976 RepID=A0AA41QJ16_9MICO|nr:isochorismatase family protein [Antribacter soli]MCF4123635.1 isochorismatase family protein [Antribacter soli]
MPVTQLDDRTALVVVDLQNGFRARPTAPHAADDVIARNVELAAAFRARGLPVVLTRFTFAADGSDAARGRTDMSGRQSGGVAPEGWDQLVDDLAGHDGDVVVTKRRWGSFYGTDLDLQLRSRGVTQVVLTGVATSLGVDSTARAAHERGYHVTLAVDAMTDLNPEAHQSSVERIFPLLGETGTTAQILTLLEESRA